MCDDGGSEATRVSVLRSFNVLDTPSQPELDEIVRDAALATQVPIALISLVDSERQWFKAKHGLEVSETPRCMSFCSHAIEGADIFTVEDAAADPRFSANPLVAGDPHIRFYAGVPLEAPCGSRIGTLCVIDRAPRAGLSAREGETLSMLANRIMVELVHQKRRERLPPCDDW